ncbi:MAG: hexose kinase [Oscillospiraceae bacterium]
MFDKIITVCLNPSFDVTIWIDNFDFSEPVKAVREEVYAGGKAINVSKALTSLEVPNKCVGILGKDNSEKFLSLLNGFEFQHILIDGEIRNNFSIVSKENTMLKVNRNGFSISKSLLDNIQTIIKNNISTAKNPIIIFSGSLPTGITKEDYIALIKVFCDKVKVCIDSDCLTVKDLKEIKPFLIKPNKVEFNKLADISFTDLQDIIEYSKTLSPYITHLLISLSDDGLLYIGNSKAYWCKAPKVNVLSTVGAGDTTLAGFIYGIEKEMPIEDAIKFATACGTVSVTLEGTATIEKSQVYNFLSSMPDLELVKYDLY